MRLIALFVLILCSVSTAHAYPASNVVTFTKTVCGSGTYSTVGAACAAAATSLGQNYFGLCGNPAGTGTVGASNAGANPECTGISLYWNGALQASNQTYDLAQNTTLGCPGGGTLAASTCTCPSGYTDTGSSCVEATCPAVGAALGTQNITSGWALSPTVNANDVVTTTSASDFYGSHCVPQGSGYCSGEPDLAAAGMIAGCYRSQAPADGSGLYRISCDVVMKSTSTAACTVSSSSPSSPSAAPPACPTGNVGTVNGKSVCLGTMPTSGVNFGATPAAGNPKAGSSPIADSNAAREPSAGSGGGADARGGPGVTVGPDGAIGTGNNRSAGTGSGAGTTPGIDIPTDYQRDATGQLTNSKLQTIITDGLKVKEDGTPSSTTVGQTEQDAVQGNVDTLGTKLEGIVAGTDKPSNIGWGISSISFPTTCTPFSLGTPRWGYFTVDFCAFQPVVHDIMTLVWVSFTLFFSIGMVFRAVTGG